MINKKKMIGLFATSFLVMGVASAATSSLKTDSRIAPSAPCGAAPHVFYQTVATSIDANGTVKGQAQYVSYTVYGRGTVYNYSLYNTTWDSLGNLVAAVPVGQCIQGSPWVGNFVSGPPPYTRTYINGQYVVTSVYSVTPTSVNLVPYMWSSTITR